MAESKFTTVRVSDEELVLLKQVRERLFQVGVGNLPPGFLRSQPAQGYVKQGDFTSGLLVGLGAAALLYLISQENR